MHYVTAMTPVKICCSYKVCIEPAPMHCSTGFGKMHSALFSVALQNRLTACTMSLQLHICSFDAHTKCALSQHQCTAALVLAKCTPHCSVLLCKTGSQHALCHCNDTCEDLLFIQVCSESAPMHCSTGFGKMQSPLFSVALQNRFTACTMSLQLHLCSFAVHTGVQ